jgi:hypothetical protein
MLSVSGLRLEPMGALRAVAVAAILVMVGPLSGCSELFAPDGGVAIVVAPDTVRINEQINPPSVQLNFVIRNTNTYMIAVSPCVPDVEQETAADVWQSVKTADDCFLEPLPAGTHRPFVAFVASIPPGRYRLRSSYAVANRNGLSAMEKPPYSQISNTFVVLP